VHDVVAVAVDVDVVGKTRKRKSQEFLSRQFEQFL